MRISKMFIHYIAVHYIAVGSVHCSTTIIENKKYIYTNHQHILVFITHFEKSNYLTVKWNQEENINMLGELKHTQLRLNTL